MHGVAESLRFWGRECGGLISPEFIDLARSIAYYQKLGFAFGEPWNGF